MSPSLLTAYNNLEHSLKWIKNEAAGISAHDSETDESKHEQRNEQQNHIGLTAKTNRDTGIRDLLRGVRGRHGISALDTYVR